MPDLHAEMTTPNVFRSYRRSNASGFVQRLHDALEASGVDAWLDVCDMPSALLAALGAIENPVRSSDAPQDHRSHLAKHKVGVHGMGGCASSNDAAPPARRERA